MAWLDAPRSDEGIRHATDDGWETRPYDEIAARVRAAAAQLAEAPDRRPVVAIVVRAGLDFTATFYGALLAGRTPCPIVPPGSFERLERYREHVVRLLEVARPGTVVADPDLVPIIGEAARQAYHDMGLIAGLVLPLSRQCALTHLRPDQFIRSPQRYLECSGRDGATNTTTPTFGFAYAVRRTRPEDLRGMDFSGWASAAVGAERVGAAALYRFARLLEPHGFDPAAFAPGFGMAEATLQVTGTRLRRCRGPSGWIRRASGSPAGCTLTA